MEKGLSPPVWSGAGLSSNEIVEAGALMSRTPGAPASNCFAAGVLRPNR